MDGNVKVMISRLPSWVAVSIFNDKLFIKSDTLILIRNHLCFVFTPALSTLTPVTGDGTARLRAVTSSVW